MTFRRILKIATMSFALCCTACGGASDQVHETDIAADLAEQGIHPAQKENADAATKPAVISTVNRAELNGLLDRGPAAVLAMVQVDASLENGRFVGWKIISFRTEAQEILGLRVDDVLTQVNSLPLERPDQMDLVYKKLKSENRIAFDIVRDGKKLQLVTPINP